MIDSLARYSSGALFVADLCIIGAGPLGIAIAREFVEGTTRVLLVESGDEMPEGAAQVLNRGRVSGADFSGLEDGRVRAFGGTSWTWSGQCLPLDPEVLTRRPWLAAADWPIGADALDAYRERAANFFGIPPTVLVDDVWSQFGIPPLTVDERVIRTRASAFARPLNVGRVYAQAFRRSQVVTTLLNATVMRLHLCPSGDAAYEVEVATLGGIRARIRAGAFVLCCGGIENARLLMLSGDLRHRLSALGRFLQEHPRASCARLEPIDRRLLHDQFAMFHRRGRRYLPGLALSAEEQQRSSVLACHANVWWTPPASGIALRRLGQRPRGAQATAQILAQVAADLPGLASAVGRRARGLSSAPRTGDMWLELRSEQAPIPDNRLTLAQEPDALGLPQVRVHWRVGELERRTMVAMVTAIGAELRRLRLALVQPAEWLYEPQNWATHVSHAHHHMGTTRMAKTPAEGVVNRDGAVHGVENVFVAGTSVFPSSGAVNPTFAAVALAIRLADHLKRETVRT